MAGLKPGITVVIPTIPPRKKLLERAFSSVQAQTLPAYDVLVSEDLLREGAAATRNKAIPLVKTEWVAFLDDDDEFLPNHLELLLARAEQDSADLVYPWFKVIGGTDPLAVSLDGKLVSPLGVPFTEERANYILTAGNFIPVTHLSRTQIIQDLGGFPQPNTDVWPYPDNEDWGLLQGMLRVGAKFSHEPTVTWLWHHDSGNTSGRPDRW